MSTLEESPAAIELWLAHKSRAVDSGQFCRRILGARLQCDPRELVFITGENGKPELSPPRPAFNISHSGDWFACAISSAGPVGVDIEQRSRKRRIMVLARRFFANSEIATLDRLPEDAQRTHFYDLWTLKEAAVKAQGDALPPNLKKRSFELRTAGDPDLPGAVLAAGGNRSEHFFLLEVLAGFSVALCTLGTGSRPPLKIYLENEDTPPEEVEPVLKAVSSWQAVEKTAGD